MTRHDDEEAMTEAGPIACSVAITGRVQGVGYRWSCAQAAERHGVTGWVRNFPDGSVQAWFEGGPEEVDAVVTWANLGPAGAKVTKVVTATQPPQGFTSFEIRQ